MPLNTSDAIKLGTDTIDKIYLGSDVVYTVSGEKLATVSLTSTSTMAVKNITFEMLVESSTIPTFSNIAGGTLDIVEEETGVWRVISTDVITTFNFHYEGGPEYYNYATSVIVIKGDTLTSLNSGTYGTFEGLALMTYFEWQGACNATNASRAWSAAYVLEEIILPDLSSVTDFSHAFYWNAALIVFPYINTSNGTDFEAMFRSCQALECLTNIDTTNQTNTTNMFYDCPSLLRPADLEIIEILAGTNWVNSNPCVNAGVPPIYNLTEVLIDG